ncbi:MAG: T9SS type A sorting domain-containing protein [Flavobacteriales bacterium]|nr:T9SS type A sorting domain-containing protein [Flavobacteriales bacterium]
MVSEFGCESEHSDSLFFKKAGVEELPAFLVKIYPKPSDGNVTLEFEEPGNYELEVFEMAGKLVLSKAAHIVNRTTLRIPQQGSYLIRITNASGEMVQRSLQVG